MKIENINTTALSVALATTIGQEQAQVIEKLYISLNEAMNAGYSAGFKAAEDMYKKDLSEDGIRAPIVNAQAEGSEVTPRETSRSGGAYDAGYDTGYDAGFDRGYDAGYLDAEDEYAPAPAVARNGMSAEDVAEYKEGKDYIEALYANCEALDKEMARLDEAKDRFVDDVSYLHR